MNPEQTYSERRIRVGFWLVAVLVCVSALCIIISWAYRRQQVTMAEGVNAIRDFRSARIDLANGLLHLGAGKNGPGVFDMQAGEALLKQALVRMDRTLASQDWGSEAEAVRKKVQLKQAMDDFEGRLQEWRDAETVDIGRELALRTTFMRLEELAAKTDLHLRARLDVFGGRATRGFQTVLVVSLVLLVCILLAMVMITAAEARARALIKRRADGQRLLLRMSRWGLEREESSTAFADECLRIAGEYLGLEAGWCYRAGEGGADLVLMAARGPGKSAGENRVRTAWPALLGVGGGSASPQMLLLRGRPAADPGAPPAHLGVPGVRCYAACPLLARDGSLLGVVALAGERRRALDAAEAEFFETLCGLAALLAERSAAVEQLRERESRFRQMADCVPQLLWTCDATGVCDFLSRRWEDFTGLGADRQLGYGWLEQAHPDDRAALKGKWEEAVRTGTAFEMEYRLRHHSGAFRWFYARGAPLIGADGRVVKWFGSNTDITERRKAEDALRESEERLQLFIEHAPAALAMFDRQVCYITASRRWRDDFSLGDRPLAGVSHYQVFPEVSDAWKDVHRRALAGETLRASEDRFVRTDGFVQWLSWEVRPWYDAGGRIGGIVMFSEDITARKQTETALAASEQSFRRLYSTMTQGVVYQDASGRITAMNPAAERILGKTPDEFLGSTSAEEAVDTVREDGSPFPGAEHPTMVALRTGREVAGVVMGVHNPQEKRMRWISVSAVPLFRDGDRHPSEVYAIFDDITERKLADEQLRFQAALLKETGHIAKVGGWSFDVETGAGTWTEEVARIHDLDPSEPATRDEGLRYYVPESRERINAAITAAVKHGKPYDLELELRTAKGLTKWVRTIGHPEIRNGRTVRLHGSFQDITDRKRAEYIAEIQRQVLEMIACNAPLADTLQRLLELVERQSTDGCICSIMLYDPRTRRLSNAASVSLPAAYNRAVEGLEAGPSAGSCGTAVHRREPVLVDDIATDPLWERFRHLALSHGFQACWSFPMLGDRGQVLGTFAVYGRHAGPMDPQLRKLIEASAHTAAIAIARARDESAVRESEARFRELAETVAEVFWMVDSTERKTLYVNPAFERIWGRSCASICGSQDLWLETVHPEDRARVIQAMAGRNATGAYAETYRIVRPDGEIRWISDRAFPVRDAQGAVVRIVGVAEDVTEKKRIETQFLRAQRLEAVGALAGGVAHDLNNILTPVLMATGVLKSEAREPHAQELLTMIEQSARRGAGIIRQLLAFSRGQEGERVVVQPRHLIREMEGIIRETFPREIELVVKVAPDLRAVEANATQLHQVLMNLSVNARDAMPRGGSLTLAAQNYDLAPEDKHLDPSCKPGPYVLLTVTDTGEGMSQEVVTRIFEPFFTTKGVGSGTGLGLSTVLGIVRGHGGHVGVYSEVSRGTQFKVYLPACPSAAPAAGATPVAAPGRGNGEAILVVDDEQAIRDVVRRLLEKWGYRVLTAGNGEEALQVALRESAKICLAITDVMMPVMDGIALARALQALDPSIRILATSGLDGEDKRRELSSAGVCEILSKPCPSMELLAAVRRNLDAAQQKTPAVKPGPVVQESQVFRGS